MRRGRGGAHQQALSTGICDVMSASWGFSPAAPTRRRVCTKVRTAAADQNKLCAAREQRRGTSQARTLTFQI